MQISLPTVRFAAKRPPNIPPDDPAGRQRFFEEQRGALLVSKETRQKLDNLAKQYNQSADVVNGKFIALKRLAALEQMRTGKVTPDEEIFKQLEEGLKPAGK